MSIIGNLIRKSCNKSELNILYFPYDGKYDVALFDLPHNFFVDGSKNIHPWLNFPYQNVTYINEFTCNNYSYDMLVINHEEAQKPFIGMAQQLHIPTLIIHHDKYNNNPYMAHKLREGKNVYEVSCNPNTTKNYIPYGLPNTTGKYNKDIPLLIASTFIPQQYPLIAALYQLFPKMVVLGNNPQLPFSQVVQSNQEYISYIQRSQIVISLNPGNPQNYEALLALKYKCGLITMGDLKQTSILVDGVNCVLTHNPDGIIAAAKNLIYNPNMLKQLVSHNTVLTSFDQTKFLDTFNTLFQDISARSFIR